MAPTGEAFDEVARVLVAGGHVVPGLTVEADGRARSWWWPLPAASHRPMVAALVGDPSPEGQRRVAAGLAEAVDAAVRRQLTRGSAPLVLVARRPGRPTVTEAWARSLVSPDPWLAASVDRAKLRALAEEVAAWVRSGAVVGGRVRLCLRVHEPGRSGAWRVELLAQDRDEPSLVVPLADVWEGRSPFGAAMVEETLGALGRLARLAPELSGVLDQAAPAELSVEGAAVLGLLRDRMIPLEDAGIGVLLPSWWAHRPRLGLRAR
ncbi:MAG: SNF2 helicase-associated domain-containing protein, partial [Acidimicrobiales bacterium]